MSKRERDDDVPDEGGGAIEEFHSVRGRLEQQLGKLTDHLQRLGNENSAELQRLMDDPSALGEVDLNTIPALNSEDQTPLERAQQVVYDAFDAESSRNRIRLARKALNISPDCADAYVILGDELAQTPQEALDYYEQGIGAGKRALGDDYFVEFGGEFWHMIESRPYMRALAGKSRALQAMGRLDDAIAVLQEMLRLNPGDNQGMRYVLIALLLETGDLDGAEALLHAYPDEGSATWLYSRALLKYWRDGNSPFSMRALANATVANPYVTPYLTGERPLPPAAPPFYSPGQESEANWLAQEQRAAWEQTPGAIDWLQDASARINDPQEIGIDGVLRYAVPGGTGPNFFLNTSTYARYTRCPECGEAMKQRVRYLTVFIEPNVIVLTRQQCRSCPNDDLLIAQADLIQPYLEHALHQVNPDLIGNDYVVVGDIPANVFRKRGDGPLDPEWVKAQTIPFREQRRYPEPFWGWYATPDISDIWGHEDDGVDADDYDFSDFADDSSPPLGLPGGDQQKGKS
jgi:tetratricopeptide (TPR) repeat protein